VNLEITSALAATRPLAFMQAMAALVGPGGAAAFERLLWGTGAMAFHPQPPLAAFWDSFEFPAELIEKAGLPPVTQEAKRKILFDNYVRMTGIDLQSRLPACSEDSFGRKRAEKIAAPFSTIAMAH
jgi:hypothetical protein